jgi:hypothetical protein
MINTTYRLFTNPNFLSGFKKLDDCNSVTGTEILQWLIVSKQIQEAFEIAKAAVEKAPEKEAEILGQELTIKADKLSFDHAIKAGLAPKELRAMTDIITQP